MSDTIKVLLVDGPCAGDSIFTSCREVDVPYGTLRDMRIAQYVASPDDLATFKYVGDITSEPKPRLVNLSTYQASVEIGGEIITFPLTVDEQKTVLSLFPELTKRALLLHSGSVEQLMDMVKYY